MAQVGSLYAGKEAERRLREIVTPEGVRLTLELADRGERAAAVLLDLIFLLVFVAGFTIILMLLIVGGLSAHWGLVCILVMFFLARNFYFSFFELYWHGQTPGKRLLGLRVVDRRGASLSADAVFARNFMREVELFIPMTLAMASGYYGLQAWAQLLAFVWAGIFLLMPLFNRDSLRVGDMVAGTWVIVAPKIVLLPDLLARSPDDQDGAAPLAEMAEPVKREDGPTYRFTDDQLDTYGIFELQTLEEVLRRRDRDADQVRAAVSDRIQSKIGFEAQGGDAAEPAPDRFLEAFYAELRKRLEARMLLGQRRESKEDR